MKVWKKTRRLGEGETRRSPQQLRRISPKGAGFDSPGRVSPGISTAKGAVAPTGYAVKDFFSRKLGFPRTAKYEKARFLAEPTENNSVRRESGSWLEKRNQRRRNQTRRNRYGSGGGRRSGAQTRFSFGSCRSGFFLTTGFLPNSSDMAIPVGCRPVLSGWHCVGRGRSALM